MIVESSSNCLLSATFFCQSPDGSDLSIDGLARDGFITDGLSSDGLITDGLGTDWISVINFGSTIKAMEENATIVQGEFDRNCL